MNRVATERTDFRGKRSFSLILYRGVFFLQYISHSCTREVSVPLARRLLLG